MTVAGGPTVTNDGVDKPIETESPRCARRHALYCLIVTLAVITLKLWIARDIKASAMAFDDYEYINKSPYYLRGDTTLKSYPYQNIPSGILYPLIISPWLLFDDPGCRIYVIHVINILLSGITIFFGARTIARLSGSNHFLPPLCLAAMPTIFIFSFHAMTENFAFAMLAILAWLVLDFERTCTKSAYLIGMLLAVLLLLLTRIPGNAVVPALLSLIWMHRHGIGRRRAGLIAFCIFLTSAGTFLVHSTMAPTWLGRPQHSHYLDILASFARNPQYWLIALRQTGNQIAYLLISGGYWILPVLLAVAIQIRRWSPSVARNRWRDYLIFTGISSAIFVLICVLHLLLAADMGQEGHQSRIYGRLNDPALVLIVLGGIASAFVIQRPQWWEYILLNILAPIGLCLAVGLILQLKWPPTVQQTGIAFFQRYWHGMTITLLGTTTAITLLQLAPWRNWRVPIWLGVLLMYFLVSNFHAIGTATRPGTVRVAAAKIADTQKAAEWIHNNLPKTARLGCDASVKYDRVIEPYRMNQVYQICWFSTYPRPHILVNTDADLSHCDYFFTTATAGNPYNLPCVWSDGYFMLFRTTGEKK